MSRGDTTRAAPIGAALLAALLIGACSGGKTVGQGERPVSFYLGTPNGTTSFGMSECGTATLQALLVFDGSAGRQLGDYSSRALWQSDAPDIVAVSDGTLDIGGGGALAAGTIVARAPGVATISAKYLDFSATASVVVVPVQQLYISPSLTDLAPNLDQQYTLYGVFADGGAPIDITNQAKWDLNGEDVRAYLQATPGLVHAAAAAAGGDPVKLFAELPVCGLSAQTQFQVTDLQSLLLDYEFPVPANLPVGTSEKVRVWGVFAGAGHAQQNLSRQVDVRNNFSPALTPLVGSDSLILQATDLAHGAFITVGLYNFAFSVPTQPMNFVTDPLVNVAIAPQDKNLQITYPDTGQLDAIGQFTSGLTIPITRHVTWTSGDPAVLAIDPTLDAAGKVTVKDVNEDVAVTVSSGSATSQTSDTATVRIFASHN